MSHFTVMKTKLARKDYLMKALSDLGYSPREGGFQIKGFGGQQTEAEIMVPDVSPGYDLGFKKNGDFYELVADWDGIRDIQSEAFVEQVQQRYAYHAVMEWTNDQGFEIAEEQVEADNTIRLTVRRMAF